VPPAPRLRRLRRYRHAGRRVIVLAVLLFAVLAAATAAIAVVAVVRDPTLVLRCDLADWPARRLPQVSFMTAADGHRFGALPAPRRREPVPTAQMSRWLPRATVAIEDRRFWQHGALDYRGILRAAVADVKHGAAVQGGSTLTQQLVRRRYLGSRHITLRRKLDEACLAIKLERRWSKARILETYLDTVFYGHGAFGVESAARIYYGRRAADLTLAQAALIAGLPQAPSDYDPLRHPHAARVRRDEVLAAMRHAGEISRARYRRAVAKGLRLRPGHRYGFHGPAAFTGYALREVDRRFGPRARFEGLHIRTTINRRLQRVAHRAITGRLRTPSDPAAALVAIDPRSGAIRAMSAYVPSGRHLHFNLASQGRRQAGSAFKVFTLTAALEQGIPLSSVWHGPPSLTIADRRCMTGTTFWQVHNFADEAAGTMTLLSAIAHSVNTIFAQVSLRIGVHKVVKMAHRLGVTSPLTPVCSLTLGPEGVSPLEMTSAFATLADHGMRHRPEALQRVKGPDGRVPERLRTAGKRVVAAHVADQATYALSSVVLSGTGVAANPGRPAAGKTGTAEDTKDAWFCGYVPQMAACVWMGYPQAEIPMHSVEGFEPVVGGSVPARIWHDFMVQALRRRPVLPQPTISRSAVQRISSIPNPGAATRGFPAGGTTTSPGRFPVKTIPGVR